MNLTSICVCPRVRPSLVPASHSTYVVCSAVQYSTIQYSAVQYQPLHLGHAEVVPQVEVQPGRGVRELLRLPPRAPRPHLAAHSALASGQMVTCSLVIHSEGVLCRNDNFCFKKKRQENKRNQLKVTYNIQCQFALVSVRVQCK